jgi:large subunit ribosomal protein L28
MAQRCEICGRGPRFGNRVSHAHKLTSRRWNINLRLVRIVRDGVRKRLRVCTACIRAGRTQSLR